MPRMVRFYPVFLLFLALLAAGCVAKTPEADAPAAPPPPETRVSLVPVKWVATRDGAPVHYVDQGSGGVPLVLVHGWGCDLTFWRAQTGPLSKGRRVIALDLPGHGLSGKPVVRYTQERFAEAVLAVMDRAGVDRAVLVGHSMGLTVIWRAAQLHPERVAALVGVDGAMSDVPGDEEGARAWRAGMEAFVATFRGPGGEAATAGFIDSMHGRETPEALKQEVREKMLATPRRVRLSAMEEFVGSEVWREGPVAVPVLAVYARSDELPPDFETVLQRSFPQLEYVLWDGPGHFFMLERPGELNELIVDFLRRRGL